MKEENSGLEFEVNAGYIHHIVGVMKKRFGEEAVILFHVTDSYECFLDDSRLVSEALGIPQEPYLTESGTTIYVTRFPAKELVEYRRRLTALGYTTCTNETRGNDGKHILKIYEPNESEEE